VRAPLRGQGHHEHHGVTSATLIVPQHNIGPIVVTLL
jgi:hypothetical protein